MRLEQIGSGQYGEVFLGKDLATQEWVALKKIKLYDEGEGFPLQAIREIKLLRRIDHDNVMTLREVVRSRGMHLLGHECH